jgi:beta-lactamase superfamily II metal-dependent hydrolase
MSIVKSFSVGNGDTFYVKHGSDNFTIIDCFLSDDNKKRIVDELISESSGKGISRFISTHPDDDHIRGLKYLDDRMGVMNFYCVKNEATKEDETDDFTRYCELRDSDKKSFYIYKGCSRKWMNQSDETRGSSGINIKWPDTNNSEFKDALENAKNGESPNNISPIITYHINNGAKFMWMGDLEEDFMESIVDEITFTKVNILFAPHHGRKSGTVPQEWLDQMNPDIIIIGEAPSENLDYASYDNYNKITQNSAKDIIFECVDNKIHIYASNENYSVDFLDDENMSSFDYYIGSLTV